MTLRANLRSAEQLLADLEADLGHLQHATAQGLRPRRHKEILDLGLDLYLDLHLDLYPDLGLNLYLYPGPDLDLDPEPDLDLDLDLHLDLHLHYLRWLTQRITHRLRARARQRSGATRRASPSSRLPDHYGYRKLGA